LTVSLRSTIVFLTLKKTRIIVTKLNKIPSYLAGQQAQKQKKYNLALKEYTTALSELAEETNENLQNRALIRIQMARCYGRLALTTIFNAPAELSDSPELRNFHLAINEASTIATAFTGRELRRGKIIQTAIAAAKTLLLKKLTDPANPVLSAVRIRALATHPTKNFDVLAQEELAFLRQFYQRHLQDLGTDYNFYLVTAMTNLAQLAIQQGSRARGAAGITWYRSAIRLLDQALPLSGSMALVKPATLYFDRWYATEQIAILSNDKAEKTRIYKEILAQFADIFEFSETWETDKAYFHKRTTQYAYAAYFAHRANLALASLEQTDALKTKHQEVAQLLQQQFSRMSAAILPSELPGMHATNLLCAIASLTTLSEGRARSKKKLRDGLEDKDGGNDSDYQETASKAPSKSSAASRKRSLPANEPESSESSSESDSDLEREDSSHDDMILSDRVKKEKAKPTTASENKALSQTGPSSNSNATMKIERTENKASAQSFMALSLLANTSMTLFQSTSAATIQSTSTASTHNTATARSTSSIAVQSIGLGTILTASSQAPALPFFKRQLEDRSWYTDAHILAALDRRLRGEIDRREVLVFGCIEMRDVVPQILARRAEQLARLARGETVARKFLIGINIAQNHWAALSVNFVNGFNSTPAVTYADPLSTQVPSTLHSQLWRSLHVIGIRRPQEIYQQDSYNCGAWTVVFLESLGKSGHLPLRSSINIAQERASDRQYSQAENDSDRAPTAKKLKQG
jgi:hypothetical protein